MALWNYMEDGFWELEEAGCRILKAYACVESTDGRRVDTRTAVLKGREEADGTLLLQFVGEEGLILTERLGQTSQGMAWADCTLRSADEKEVSTRLLMPLVFSSPRTEEGEDSPAICPMTTPCGCVMRPFLCRQDEEAMS